MDNLIIILIIGIYGIYKMVDRVCQYKEFLEDEGDTALCNIVEKLVDENIELCERLLEKEVEDEDRV